jgi:hypothetical protein
MLCATSVKDDDSDDDRDYLHPKPLSPLSTLSSHQLGLQLSNTLKTSSKTAEGDDMPPLASVKDDDSDDDRDYLHDYEQKVLYSKTRSSPPPQMPSLQIKRERSTGILICPFASFILLICLLKTFIICR